MSSIQRCPDDRERLYFRTIVYNTHTHTHTHTQEEVEKYMEEACSILGKFEAECKELIDTYFDRIWKMLMDELVS